MPEIHDVNQLKNIDLNHFSVIGLYDLSTNSIVSERSNIPYLFAIDRRGMTSVGVYVRDRKNKIGKNRFGIETSNQLALFFEKIDNGIIYFSSESGKKITVKIGEIDKSNLNSISTNDSMPKRKQFDNGIVNKNIRFRGNAIGNAQNLFIRNILSNLGEESFSQNDWEETISFFERKCAYCGADAPLEMEHAIPINKEKLGEHKIGNIVPSCNNCNKRKHYSDYKEFLADSPDRIFKIESYMESRNYTPLASTPYAEKIRKILEIGHSEVGYISKKYIEIINEIAR
jgi:hypothetical protein